MTLAVKPDDAPGAGDGNIHGPLGSIELAKI